jgi:type I site-specific restriction endonuclease
MSEAEARVELIDPKLKESGWGAGEGAKIRIGIPQAGACQRLPIMKG